MTRQKKAPVSGRFLYCQTDLWLPSYASFWIVSLWKKISVLNCVIIKHFILPSATTLKSLKNKLQEETKFNWNSILRSNFTYSNFLSALVRYFEFHTHLFYVLHIFGILHLQYIHLYIWCVSYFFSPLLRHFELRPDLVFDFESNFEVKFSFI